jgi:hypothetical protein
MRSVLFASLRQFELIFRASEFSRFALRAICVSALPRLRVSALPRLRVSALAVELRKEVPTSADEELWHLFEDDRPEGVDDDAEEDGRLEKPGDGPLSQRQ